MSIWSIALLWDVLDGLCLSSKFFMAPEPLYPTAMVYTEQIYIGDLMIFVTRCLWDLLLYYSLDLDLGCLQAVTLKSCLKANNLQWLLLTSIILKSFALRGHMDMWRSFIWLRVLRRLDNLGLKIESERVGKFFRSGNRSWGQNGSLNKKPKISHRIKCAASHEIWDINIQQESKLPMRRALFSTLSIRPQLPTGKDIKFQ